MEVRMCDGCGEVVGTNNIQTVHDLQGSFIYAYNFDLCPKCLEKHKELKENMENELKQIKDKYSQLEKDIIKNFKFKEEE